MLTIDLTDAELAALVAAIRRVIEQDRFPHAPRLDRLRAALAKLDPKTPPPTQGGKTRPLVIRKGSVLKRADSLYKAGRIAINPDFARA